MKRLLPFVIDLVLVLAFAVIGRASHDENPVIGALGTAWPFIVACLIGWGIVLLLEDDGLGLRGGAIIWFFTLAGGQALRVISGGTTQVSFILVTAIVLGVFLGGWRLVAWLLRRRRATA